MPLSARLQDEALVHLFYLHGFASSPASGKAAFFGERLARYGLDLQRPDFNLPDFSTLTITRMLDQLDEAIARLEPGPVVLIGSSLGGFVAIHAAVRRAGRDEAHPIAALVLLAPAVDFGSDRDAHLGPDEIRQWRLDTWHEVFHYGYGRSERVHVGLYEDAHRYDALGVRASVPTLVFQGSVDEVVNPRSVVRYAALHPTARLRLVPDGHQLQQHMDFMWDEMASFLRLDGLR